MMQFPCLGQHCTVLVILLARFARFSPTFGSGASDPFCGETMAFGDDLVRGLAGAVKEIEEEAGKVVEDAEKAVKEAAEETVAKAISKLDVPKPCGETTITNQELLDRVQTGDLLLWSGTSEEGILIRFATHSCFSHASMVIRGALDASEVGTEVEKIPRLLQSTWSEFKEDVDGSHKPVERSVMINDLKDVLLSNEKDSEPATLRSISIPPERADKFHDLISAKALETDHVKYPTGHIGNLAVPDPADLIHALTGAKNKVLPDTYFCSEVVAVCLTAAGVLDTSERPPQRWTPGDLSDLNEPLFRDHLLNGFTYSDEIRVARVE
jgi:hypothetical protein